MAFGITAITADAGDVYIQLPETGDGIMKRHEQIEINIQSYGSSCMENAHLLRDGLHINQNRDALQTAGFSFVEGQPVNYVPELINGRWHPRADTVLVFNREVSGTYSILSLLQAEGTINGNEFESPL
jgi:hypothetical protein